MILNDIETMDFKQVQEHLRKTVDNYDLISIEMNYNKIVNVHFQRDTFMDIFKNETELVVRKRTSENYPIKVEYKEISGQNHFALMKKEQAEKYFGEKKISEIMGGN